MTDTAIQVEHLSKQYPIGRLLNGYSTLRETITDSLMKPLRWAGGLWRHGAVQRDEREDTVWALKDVSFHVRPGEVVGIIGRNGAGKSTLLKILSQITEPSDGFADIEGRVAALLEVGTGFHPELTGRENLYLNGAILGMTRREIERKFHDIVAFAGVERFIDTPVKHYSSGMCVRLAFAVAAHLEPEILIIDEVLAVGDAVFQKKCLWKMEGVAKQGRTVLFVSHNMLAVQSLCHRVIWLQDGQVVQDGDPSHVIAQYLRTATSSSTEQSWTDMDTAPGNDKVRLRKIRARALGPSDSAAIAIERPFTIEVEFWNQCPDADLHATLHVYTEQGVMAFSTGAGQSATLEENHLPVGLFRSICHVPANLLNSGVHKIVLLIVENRSRVIYRHEDALSFEIAEVGKRDFGWQGREPGVVRPLLKWTTDRIHESASIGAV